MTYQFKAKLAERIINNFTVSLKIVIEGDDILITETATNPSPDNIKPLCLQDEDWEMIDFNGTQGWNKWTENLSGDYKICIRDLTILFEEEIDAILYQLSWL